MSSSLSPPPEMGEPSSSVLPAVDDLAFRDDLTGLHNRRHLTAYFSRAWRDELAARGGMTVLILDLDRFKEINDSFGHLVGDAVLRRAAELLRASFREDDVVVRYGGDEFVVILPGLAAAEAERLAERARLALGEETLPSAEPAASRHFPVSFSFGLAVAPTDGTDGEEVLAAADARLLATKKRHRGPRQLQLLGLLAFALAAVVYAAVLAWSQARRPIVLEQPAAAPVERAPAVADPEVQRLRTEVERLTAELAAARISKAAEPIESGRRVALEKTIRELEGRLESLRKVATVPASAPMTPPPTLVTPPPEALPAAPAALPPRVATAVAEVSFRPPELVSMPGPAYPLLARRLRRSATVELVVEVDTAGRVTAATPLGPPLGLGFDEAARQAALLAIYRPARRGGQPVAAQARLNVAFSFVEPATP